MDNSSELRIVVNCPHHIDEYSHSNGVVTIDRIHSDFLSLVVNKRKIECADLVIWVEWEDSPLFLWPETARGVARVLAAANLVPNDTYRRVPNYRFKSLENRRIDEECWKVFTCSPRQYPDEDPKEVFRKFVTPEEGVEEFNMAHGFAHCILSGIAVESQQEVKLNVSKLFRLLMLPFFQPLLPEKPRHVIIIGDYSSYPCFGPLRENNGIINEKIAAPVLSLLYERGDILNASTEAPCDVFVQFVERLMLKHSINFPALPTSNSIVAHAVGAGAHYRFLSTKAGATVGVQIRQGSANFAIAEMRRNALGRREQDALINGCMHHWMVSVHPELCTQLPCEQVPASGMLAASTMNAETPVVAKTPSSETRAEHSRGRLVLMSPKKDGGKFRISVRGKEREIDPAQTAAILALAIAKLQATESEFPGIRNDDAKTLGGRLLAAIGVKDMAKIVLTGRKGLCGLNRDDSTHVTQYDKQVILERIPKDQNTSSASKMNAYELDWPKENIDISHLVTYVKRPHQKVHPPIRNLVNIFGQKK